MARCGVPLAALANPLTSDEPGATLARGCGLAGRASWSGVGAWVAVLAVLALVLGGPRAASADATLPAGFSEQVVASGLTNPGSMAFFPDGRIAIGEKAGIVKLVKNGVLQTTPLIDLRSRVNDYWDRGLLGLAVDPNFPAQPYLWVVYTYESNAQDYTGGKNGRVSRFTVSGDTADIATEVPILGSVVGTSCNNLPLNTDCIPSDAPSHTVGNLKFASDGTLFVTLGDAGSFNSPNTDSLRAQNLDSLSGKLVHITTTGQGLATNPFWTGNANDIRSKVWAYGFRNAFRFNLRPGSGVPYVGDVGWDTWEEVNVVKAGTNQGWPCYEGEFPQPGYASFATCQALINGNGGAGIKSQGTPFARVPASLGIGGAVAVIANGDYPPVGSGDSARQYDSWDGNNTTPAEWVGYTFPSSHTFNKVIFQEGIQFWDGGWFTTLTVQVRQGANWVNVTNLISTPAYPGNNGINFESFALTFDPIQGDGIRLYGAPGGAAQFISVAELDVFEVSSGGGGGGGGGGGTPVESQVQSQATAVIAKVPASLGAGAAVAVIRNGDMPPVGSGDSSRQYDSWDGNNPATEDWVGYTFASTQTFTKVVFQEGIQFWDGGWFNTLTVQVRQGGTWVNVTNLVSTPAYPGANGVNYETFTLTFNQVQGDGIRIYGAPGGSGAFISVGELQVFAMTTGSSTPSPVTPPLYAWNHNGVSSAVVGGTFYTGTVYPAQYQGAYFFGDYVRGWIKTLLVDANDALVPNSVADFALNAGAPVDIQMGADGLLYYVAIGDAQVRRILYTTGNTLPVAAASGNPTSGPDPTLDVQFSSAGSNDPDNDPITFEWDFDDGSPIDTTPNPVHTYAHGQYVAKLTVRDNRQGVAVATVPITVGSAPVASIITPQSTLQYAVGDVITYQGQDPGANVTLTWQIVLHHCQGGVCHTHPWASGTGLTGNFTIPDHGDTSYFEIVLTAKENGTHGLSSTVSVTIQPQPVQLSFATSPAGLKVIYDGAEQTTPWSVTSIAKSQHVINVTSPQGGNAFQSWSDGGAQSHTITLGTAASAAYTATFGTSTGCPIGQFRAQYFNNTTLTGTPAFTRCETSINYNYGTGGPGNGIGVNNFSVRWQGTFTFTAGSKTFTTVSDDGVRLWLDNVQLINRWTDHGATTDRATRTVTAGNHEVKVEYYENGGQAVIQVSW